MSSSSNIKSIEDYKDKVKLLKDVKKDLTTKINEYKKKYKKLKKYDDIIDASTSLLSASSISCTIIGMTLPPLLIVSASLSGISFIISRVQDKYNLKRRYEQHHLTINQYSNLVREIITVLTKNNLTSEQYHNYLTEVYDKISLIEDTSIVI